MTRALLALPWLLLPFAVAAAPAPEVDAAARAIYGDFMSPYCPGLLLTDCRSQAAVELRGQIHAELAAGKSEEEVRAALEATYGEKLRAAPPARGFGLWAWVTPGIFVLLGAGFILLWAQSRNTARPRTPVEDDVAVDPALRDRLERELKTFDVG